MPPTLHKLLEHGYQVAILGRSSGGYEQEDSEGYAVTCMQNFWKKCHAEPVPPFANQV